MGLKNNIAVKMLKMNMIQRMCRDHSLDDISSGKIWNQINNNIPSLMDGILMKIEQKQTKIQEDVVRTVVALMLYKDHVTKTAYRDRTPYIGYFANGPNWRCGICIMKCAILVNLLLKELENDQFTI